MLGRYWPTGSGIGTFERAYFIDEPDGLLGPTLMNHAHNDWLEVVITAGFGGLLLLLSAVAAFAWRAYRAASDRMQFTAEAAKTKRFVWLGLVVMALCALASVSDYPLRTPSLACVFVVAALWADCRLPVQRSTRIVAPDRV